MQKSKTPHGMKKKKKEGSKRRKGKEKKEGSKERKRRLGARSWELDDCYCLPPLAAA